MAHEETLERIDRNIQTMRIEFERFFAGGTKLPPEDIRLKVASDLRTLRNTNITSAAENFRLGTLEARFNTYNELFNRRLREREEGHAGVTREVAKPRFDAGSGITLGSAPQPEAVEALFAGMYRHSANANVDLDSFRRYITQQIAGIRQKTGCAEVQFRVTLEDGKPRLKAKPIAAPRDSAGSPARNTGP